MLNKVTNGLLHQSASGLCRTEKEQKSQKGTKKEQKRNGRVKKGKIKKQSRKESNHEGRAKEKQEA